MTSHLLAYYGLSMIIIFGTKVRYKTIVHRPVLLSAVQDQTRLRTAQGAQLLRAVLHPDLFPSINSASL